MIIGLDEFLYWVALKKEIPEKEEEGRQTEEDGNLEAERREDV